MFDNKNIINNSTESKLAAFVLLPVYSSLFYDQETGFGLGFPKPKSNNLLK